MESGRKMVSQQMETKTFQGLLDHKNPNCEVCFGHTMSIYSGGRKDRMPGMYLCNKCGVIYVLPSKKKCKFTEVTA